MKALASWIGLADLAAAESGNPDAIGPIATALRTELFDRILLLSDREQPEIDDYIAWLRSAAETRRIETQRVPLSNPNAFREIYKGVTAALDDRIDDLRATDEILFYISPGTPVMAATWIILGKTRYHQLPIGYLQSSEGQARRLELPFDLAANILPDVLRAADERLTLRSAGKPAGKAGFNQILHRSSKMQQVLGDAHKAARRSLSVLIEGESGTGKELLAQAIHAASPFSAGPFVAVNCGAIPENLVEAELFGHTKSAFTGATEARTGYVERADGGTLFLDEIGELPRAAQVKLLRVLQQREVVPVGATKPRKVEFRVVAATNRNLAREVAEGRFREDLYYRLCVIWLTLPPLRDRDGDVEVIADRLLDDINVELMNEPGYEPRILADEAKALLSRYAWPGNVRELQNTLQRATFLSEHALLTGLDIRRALSPAPKRSRSDDLLDRPIREGIDLREIQAEVGRHYIRMALEATGNRVTDAARLVGTSRQNLSNWMREYEITPANKG